MEFKLLQIKDIANCNYAFRMFEAAKKNGFSLDDYEVVWEEDIDSDTSLEDIFTRFNIDHPVGYTGRSMSTSDIIDLDGHKWYCDAFGWVELK